MAEYSAVKGGKLKLKKGGVSLLGRKKKTKRKKPTEQEEWMKEPGAMRHGKFERYYFFSVVFYIIYINRSIRLSSVMSLLSSTVCTM